MKNKALAEKLGVDPVVISRYTTGKHLPDCATLYNISKILGYNMNWLMGDVEDEDPEVEYWKEKYCEVYGELEKLRAALKSFMGNLSK